MDWPQTNINNVLYNICDVLVPAFFFFKMTFQFMQSGRENKAFQIVYHSHVHICVLKYKTKKKMQKNEKCKNN